MEAKTKYLLLLFIAGGVIFFFNIGGRDLLRLEKETAVQINPIEQVKIANRDIVLISNR